MPAVCKCVNGHTFSTSILEDDHTINSFVTKADEEGCPECGADEFEVIEIECDEPWGD